VRPGPAVGVAALALLALAALLAPPARADGSSGIEGGEGVLQLYVTVDSSFDLVEVGRSIPGEVFVEDSHGIPQPAVPVLLWTSAGAVSPSRVLTGLDGKAPFVYTADVDESMIVRIVARTVLATEVAQGVDDFHVRVVRLPPPPVFEKATLVSAGVLGVIVAFFLTKTGHSALISLAFPLYTRLKREEVLDHFVRGQIFGAIRTRPGTTFTEIRRDLRLSNGSLSYHLRMLEVQGFVRSEREGVHRRFFPAEVSSVEDDGVHLSHLQRQLLDRLRRNPVATQRALAKEIGVTQQCVSYNLLFLRRQGSVDRVVENGRLRYRVLES